MGFAAFDSAPFDIWWDLVGVVAGLSRTGRSMRLSSRMNPLGKGLGLGSEERVRS
jgi:hypothetical protein